MKGTGVPGAEIKVGEEHTRSTVMTETSSGVAQGRRRSSAEKSKHRHQSCGKRICKIF